ncbi:CotH kinase family protein [Subdoligranulum variabile]|uniref:CotH protein n=1 Tax=Subdoligranulum variabile DSM 15176 TaxID=411471 RepID=D1PPX0_9FIRM|nr:CotH kinase family protein [Subdoligranulum variabile]EFB75316.1 CotH protein [Subdoligranulum variabile DSM 15176]UWP69220.1 CotH kinase family protein [Subdoligranulum variabile]
MPTAANKLRRFLPPVLALAALGGVCLWEVDRIAARSRGYGNRMVVINEICAHNLSGLQDGNGNCGDWIELYNPYGGTIDLSGWTLTDDKDDPDRWTFPDGTVLEDYLVLFADGADTVDPAGYCHTAFALKTRGETLYLYDADGELVDHLKYPEQDFDITYGRAFGNGEDKGTFATATPGAANPVDFLDENREANLGTAEFSLPAGFYDEPVEVALSTDDPDALIFYTTDGSDPAENGTLYTGPITVESRAGEPNRYVSLPNRFEQGESLFLKSYAYRYAPDPVDKATTITARIYKDGSWSEECRAATYWVGVEAHTLPVISITADEQDLFGAEGIYTPGATYYTMMQQGSQEYQANFLSGEEIDAQIQLIGEEDTGSLDSRISVAGQATRLWMQMKNLSVHLTGSSEEKLAQAGIEDTPGGFSLKGPGNGSWQYFYVDGFWNNYLYGTGLGTQYNVPVVLYLEDEYWGIYCARESKNAELIERQYGVDADSVVICTHAEPDEDNSIAALESTLKELPCSESSWNWLCETFDIDSFIDYAIPQLYSNNWDGLRMPSNIYIWKADEGSSRYADGRWRFLLNDLDQSLIYGFMDPIGDLLDNPAQDTNIQQLLFQKLWEYEEFRTRFAEKFRTAMETTYAPEHILPAFEAWCAQLEPEMERNITRQKVETTVLAPLADKLTDSESSAEEMTMEQWQADYATLCDFLTNRADDLLEYLDMHLAEAENGI